MWGNGWRGPNQGPRKPWDTNATLMAHYHAFKCWMGNSFIQPYHPPWSMQCYLFYSGSWVLQVTSEWRLVLHQQPDAQFPSLKGSLPLCILLRWVLRPETWGKLREKKKKKMRNFQPADKRHSSLKKQKHKGAIMRTLLRRTVRVLGDGGGGVPSVHLCLLHGFILLVLC